MALIGETVALRGAESLHRRAAARVGDSGGGVALEDPVKYSVRGVAAAWPFGSMRLSQEADAQTHHPRLCPLRHDARTLWRMTLAIANPLD